MAATGERDGEGVPPGEGVAPAFPASQPQGVAAAGGEGVEVEGVEEPPGKMRAPAWAGRETAGEARRGEGLLRPPLRSGGEGSPPQDGKTYGSQQELPLARNAADGDSERPLTPAGDAAAVGAGEGRPRRGAEDFHGIMENAETVSTR